VSELSHIPTHLLDTPIPKWQSIHMFAESAKNGNKSQQLIVLEKDIPIRF
jgi:hypothetical protein